MKVYTTREVEEVLCRAAEEFRRDARQIREGLISEPPGGLNLTSEERANLYEEIAGCFDLVANQVAYRLAMYKGEKSS